jgi:hypothetical protein
MRLLKFLPVVLLSVAPGVFSSAQGPQINSISANSGSTSFARVPDSRGWTDPALNHNKLLQNQAGEGMYKLIGPYKVIGTSYLFGEHHKGDMFSVEAKALNIYISYNTYNQEVEFYSTSNPDKPLIKEPGDLDSFTLKQNKELGMESDMKFLYGAQLGSKDKSYFLEMATGNYKLYKRYKSDLKMSSTNYVQSELREFDLQYEYYYTGGSAKGLKKIKPNASSFIKEFKDIKDLSGILTTEEFSMNQENAMRKAIIHLNAQ